MYLQHNLLHTLTFIFLKLLYIYHFLVLLIPIFFGVWRYAALGSQQPHALLQAGDRVPGKLPGGKGPGGADQCQLTISQLFKGGQEGQDSPGLD